MTRMGRMYQVSVGITYAAMKSICSGVIGNAIGGEAAAIGIPALLDGALDLDAAEASAMFDDDVIGRAIAPRLGGTESECDGAGHEAQFGPFAPHLGVADGHSERFHG